MVENNAVSCKNNKISFIKLLYYTTIKGTKIWKGDGRLGGRTRRKEHLFCNKNSFQVTDIKYLNN